MHPNPFVSTARTIKEGRLRLGMNAREFAEAVGDGRDSLPDNAIVVVEPELVARPGDFVVAQVDADGLTLRQLVQEAGHRMLKPLNARYPITPLHEAHILGVVRELSRVYR